MRMLCMAVMLACLLGSCRREDIKNPEIENNSGLVNKVNEWLDKQKATFTKDGITKIQSLKENLDFLIMTTEVLKTKETVIIIPVKNSFKTNINRDKHPVNSLVLFMNTNNEIRKGHIIQYISSVQMNSKSVLSKFFTEYFSSDIKNFTGSIAYLTIADEFTYEINYNNGKVIYYKSADKKKLSGRTQICFEFGYYYYWSDGSVTWEPVGGYCDGCEPVRTINGITYKSNCGGGGGGGGGGEDPGEPNATTMKYWEVYREEAFGPSSYIAVQAKIQLWGKKVSTEHQGGHFTGYSGASSFSENFHYYQMQWQQINNNFWHGAQHAHHTVSGNIIHPPNTDPPEYIYKTNDWQFIDVF